ncbi:cellular response to virus [Fragilaria crotonensis]|nr:cellular response to virus [Fragilaria crotonensis]
MMALGTNAESPSIFCPESQPVVGSSCAPFGDYNLCNYGEFCCPDKDGACTTDTICFCDSDSTVSCHQDQEWGSIPCVSVCPETPPANGDKCDVDSRFKCSYGNPFVCDSTGMSYDSEHECYCADGVFVCNSNACPVSCPLEKPSDGDTCKPFVDYTCTYGELCCPGDTNETCVPEKTCSCEDSAIQCYQAESEGSLLCPSLCPDKPPDTFDTCNIDSRFLCAYGNPMVCDEAGWTFENEKQCYCYDGHFVCSSNVCPVGCPVTPPKAGDSCSASFASYSCSYGEVCCPGDDESDVCVPETSCYCDESDMTIKCLEPSIVCPSVCPVSKPIDGDTLCNIDERYVCEYNTGVCPIPFDYPDAICTCSSGHYACQDYCPIMSVDFGDLDGPPVSPFVPGTPEEVVTSPSAVLDDTDGGLDQSNDKKKKGKAKKKKRKKSTEKDRRDDKGDGKTRKLLRSKLED